MKVLEPIALSRDQRLLSLVKSTIAKSHPWLKLINNLDFGETRSSVGNRKKLWAYALGFAAHPILGIGVGNFEPYYRSFASVVKKLQVITLTLKSWLRLVLSVLLFFLAMTGGSFRLIRF